MNNINLSQPNLQVKQTQSNSTQIQTTEFPDLSEVSNASNEIDSHQQNSKPIMPSSLLSQNLNSANPQQKSQSHQKASNPIDQINNILKH